MSTGESSSQEASPGSIAALTLDWARTNGVPYWFARETTSTNTIAKARVSYAGAPARAMLLLTEKQTAGRGRGSHAWSTPTNALLSTWSFPLPYAPQPILSPLVGLAVFEAASKAFKHVSFNLKAPNDLYVGSQKIAGLLIETVMVGPAVTCAIGLGFNAGEAPPGVEASAGLESFLDRHEIQKNWPVFLNGLRDGFSAALAAARSSEMSIAQRESLKTALNLYSHLSEPILDVGALGELKMASRTLNWSEL